MYCVHVLCLDVEGCSRLAWEVEPTAFPELWNEPHAHHSPGTYVL